MAARILSFFLYFSEYALLKGWLPALPFLQKLFATPFLIFFSVFLFCGAFILSLWRHFFQQRTWLFGLSAVVSFFLFLFFVSNF